MTSREEFIIANELTTAEQDIAWAEQQQAAFDEAARRTQAWRMGALGTAEALEEAA